MIDYSATRWYRSPELLLSEGIYMPDVNYWVVGCIIRELADGNYMLTGENETDQINWIIKVLGNLSWRISRYILSKLNIWKKKIKLYMKKLGPTAIDSMKGLLQLDPKKRLNSETVFKHKYFHILWKMKKEGKKLMNL